MASPSDKWSRTFVFREGEAKHKLDVIARRQHAGAAVTLSLKWPDPKRSTVMLSTASTATTNSETGRIISASFEPVSMVVSIRYQLGDAGQTSLQLYVGGCVADDIKHLVGEIEARIKSLKEKPAVASTSRILQDFEMPPPPRALPAPRPPTVSSPYFGQPAARPVSVHHPYAAPDSRHDATFKGGATPNKFGFGLSQQPSAQVFRHQTPQFPRPPPLPTGLSHWAHSGAPQQQQQQQQQQRGLVNLGNTCYLNACLEALLHLPPFARALLDPRVNAAAEVAASSPPGAAPTAPPAVRLSRRVVRGRGDLRMYFALHAAFRCKLLGHPLEARLLRDFKNAASAHDAAFRSSAQQDAHEFLSGALTILHEELEALAPAIVDALPYQGAAEGAAQARAARAAAAVLRAHLSSGRSLTAPLRPDEDPKSAVAACATICGLVADPYLRTQLVSAMVRLASHPATAPRAQSRAHFQSGNDALPTYDQALTEQPRAVSGGGAGLAAEAVVGEDGGLLAAADADASSFFDDTDAEFVGQVLEAAERACDKYRLSATLPTVRTVHSQITATLTCENSACDHRRQHVESFRDLPLDLPLTAQQLLQLQRTTSATSETSSASAGTKRRATVPAGEQSHASRQHAPVPEAAAAAAADGALRSRLSSGGPDVVDLCDDDHSMDGVPEKPPAPSVAAPSAPIATDDSEDSLHLHTLLRTYFAERVLELKCEKCSHGTVRVSYAVSALPRVLVLQLKRFDVDYESGLLSKRLDRVIFPEALDLTPFLADRSSSEGGSCPRVPGLPKPEGASLLEAALDAELDRARLNAVRLPPPLDLVSRADTDEQLRIYRQTWSGEEPGAGGAAASRPAVAAAVAAAASSSSAAVSAAAVPEHTPARHAFAEDSASSLYPPSRRTDGPASLRGIEQLNSGAPNFSRQPPGVAPPPVDGDSSIAAAQRTMSGIAAGRGHVLQTPSSSSRIAAGLAASSENIARVTASGGSVQGAQSKFYAADVRSSVGKPALAVGPSAPPPADASSARREPSASSAAAVAAAVVNRHAVPKHALTTLASHGSGRRAPPPSTVIDISSSSSDEGEGAGSGAAAAAAAAAAASEVASESGVAFGPVKEGRYQGKLLGSGKNGTGGGGTGNGGGEQPAKPMNALLAAVTSPRTSSGGVKRLTTTAYSVASSISGSLGMNRTGAAGSIISGAGLAASSALMAQPSCGRESSLAVPAPGGAPVQSAITASSREDADMKAAIAASLASARAAAAVGVGDSDDEDSYNIPTPDKGSAAANALLSQQQKPQKRQAAGAHGASRAEAATLAPVGVADEDDDQPIISTARPKPAPQKLPQPQPKPKLQEQQQQQQQQQQPPGLASSSNSARVATHDADVVDMSSLKSTPASPPPPPRKQPESPMHEADGLEPGPAAAAPAASDVGQTISCLVGRALPPPPHRATFRLAGVIRHEGRVARSGHYTTDARSDFSVQWPPPPANSAAAASAAGGPSRCASNSVARWSRYDDAAVTVKSAEQVLGPDGQRHAYVLLYVLEE